MMKCSFVPYEGDDKYIFVSYSHKDGDVISPILEYLNKEGFRIWYDEGIEWGTEWPESIALHLKKCEVCMAFHSKTSVISPNCRQEINYALKTRKNILSVYLEDVELSGGMDMQLTSFQSTFPYQYKEKEKFIERLVNTSILQLCREKQTIDEGKNAECKLEKNTHRISGREENFDTEINNKFKDLFDVPKESIDESLLQKKLSEIKGKKFINSIGDRFNKTDSLDNQSNEIISLIPIEYQNEISLRGKHFTIPDISGYKTIIFEVYVNVDYKSLTRCYTCEMVESTSKESGDGLGMETTYYIDDPQEDGNQILLLHFNNENNEVFINTGLLLGNSLKITKTPIRIEFQRISIDDQLNLSTSSYNLDSLTDDEIEQIKNKQTSCKEIYREATIGEDIVIIVDPETALPVQRELYFDEEYKEWKAKIKMVPNKSYFAFQIRNEETNSVRSLLDKVEIANYYKVGSCGFPKDSIKAIDYFEQDGSAFSLYEIAVLFREDESICDEELYLTYIHQAIENGCEEAVIDLLLQDVFDSNKFSQENLKVLNQLKRTDLKNFIIAYFTEKKIIEGGLDTAFKYYYDSAMLGFKPAITRINLEDETNSSELLLQEFISKSQDNEWLSDYCMGCFLAFGLDILPQKEKGKELLEKAAKNDSVYAAEALFCFFENDSDEAEALKWLKVIAANNSYLMNKLGNRLLDGVGCEVNEENDKLAFEMFQKAAERGNETAKHNLGWMYKNGRGCQIDYNKALQLFKEAERTNSFYYMGDIYEHGLGVVADMDTAIQYYEKAAEQGSKKAAKHLEELKK